MSCSCGTAKIPAQKWSDPSRPKRQRFRFGAALRAYDRASPFEKMLLFCCSMNIAEGVLVRGEYAFAARQKRGRRLSEPSSRAPVELVALVHNWGCALTEVARDLGVDVRSVYRWWRGGGIRGKALNRLRSLVDDKQAQTRAGKLVVPRAVPANGLEFTSEELPWKTQSAGGVA